MINQLAVWALTGCISWMSPALAQDVEIPVRTPVLAATLDGSWSGDLAFSPDGTILGFVTVNQLAVFDALKGVLVASAELSGAECGRVTDIGCAFSPDGIRFAAARNQDIVVLDIATRQVIIHHSMSDIGFSSFGPVAFTEDGGRIVFGGQSANVWTLDLATFKISQSQVLEGGVVSIQRLFDAGLFAIGHFNGGVDIWDIKSDRIVKTFPECESYSNSAEVCGDYLLVGCGSHVIQLWDFQSLDRPVGQIERPFMAQNFSAASRAGVLLGGTSKATNNDNESEGGSELALYDLRTTHLLTAWHAHTATGILQTAIASSGNLMASLGYDGKLLIWRWPGE